MNCRYVESRLAAYIDGELEGFEMLQVRSHVLDCQACGKELEEMRLVKASLGNLPVRCAGKDLEQRLLAMIAEEDRKTVAVPGLQMKLGWGGVAVAAMAAVCAVVVFGLNRNGVEANPVQPMAAAPRDGFEQDQIYFQSSNPLSAGVTVSYEGHTNRR